MLVANISQISKCFIWSSFGANIPNSSVYFCTSIKRRCLYARTVFSPSLAWVLECTPVESATWTNWTSREIPNKNLLTLINVNECFCENLLGTLNFWLKMSLLSLRRWMERLVEARGNWHRHLWHDTGKEWSVAKKLNAMYTAKSIENQVKWVNVNVNVEVKVEVDEGRGKRNGIEWNGVRTFDFIFSRILEWIRLPCSGH